MFTTLRAYYPRIFIKKNQKKTLFLYLTQPKHQPLNFYLQDKIFVYLKCNIKGIEAPVHLIKRLCLITGFTFQFSKRILQTLISPLVNSFSFNTLYCVITKLFWLIPVPKHKRLLYLLRAVVKFSSKHMPGICGASITLRGKLAATGNKRKSSFTALVGKGLSSKLTLSSLTEFRLLRTPVGVIGVTSIITYTH